jgi:hypothetical protein
MSDSRRGSGLEIGFTDDLYTHDSSLRVVIAPSLSSTLYKSLEPACENMSLGAGDRPLLSQLSSEKLVAEAGDSTGAQRKGNVRRWKPLPNND